jgi:hypothetical protein
MYIGLHAKYPLFLSDFTVTLIFIKYSNITFHENPSNASPQTEKWTDMIKLSLFRNFAKALKNAQHFIRDSWNPGRAFAEPWARLCGTLGAPLRNPGRLCGILGAPSRNPGRLCGILGAPLRNPGRAFAELWARVCGTLGAPLRIPGV